MSDPSVWLVIIIAITAISIRSGLDGIARAIEAQNVARKSERRKP